MDRDQQPGKQHWKAIWDALCAKWFPKLVRWFRKNGVRNDFEDMAHEVLLALRNRLEAASIDPLRRPPSEEIIDFEDRAQEVPLALRAWLEAASSDPLWRPTPGEFIDKYISGIARNILKGHWRQKEGEVPLSEDANDKESGLVQRADIAKSLRTPIRSQAEIIDLRNALEKLVRDRGITREDLRLLWMYEVEDWKANELVAWLSCRTETERAVVTRVVASGGDVTSLSLTRPALEAKNQAESALRKRLQRIRDMVRATLEGIGRKSW